jgi:hypothetical protein
VTRPEACDHYAYHGEETGYASQGIQALTGSSGSLGGSPNCQASGRIEWTYDDGRKLARAVSRRFGGDGVFGIRTPYLLAVTRSS